MFSKINVSRWLLAAALTVAVDAVALAGLTVVLTAPAHAQWFTGGDDYRRQRPQRSGGGFFQNLFGPFEQRQPYYQGGGRDYYQQQPHVTHPQQPSEASSSRAPAPKKADKDAPPPTTSIVVMGDAMADWLAYGLEDAFADAPEIGIVRKNKLNSGLLRYDVKGDLDWWHVAKDLLATEKPNYVVMMLGLGDRQNIRERDLAKEAEKKAKEADKKDTDKKDADSKTADVAPADQDAKKEQTADEGDDIVAPEPQRGKRANGVIEFRTEQWAQVYSRRIDDTIAALKSKGVPVFWVGLPSIRGTKSTADVAYLNDLYRARAEKAGAIYIDVWDGFVDDGGKFVTFGPDFEGQNRRLRSADGVFFTKYGARKLAHYVEREIRRYMSNRGPIALPSGPVSPAPSDGKPAARPLAGPVVPLTVTPQNSEALLGGGPGGSAYGDALASRVLVKGETMYAPYGRADDFVWPRSETNRPAPPPVAAAPAPDANASAALTPAAPQAIAQPEPVAAPPAEEAAPKAATRPVPKAEQPARAAQTVRPRRVEPQRIAPRADLRPSSNAPRPPAPVRQPSRGPFDWFR
jgi:hypothetical protein